MTEKKGCLQWQGVCGEKKERHKNKSEEQIHNELGPVELGVDCGVFLSGRQLLFYYHS